MAPRNKIIKPAGVEPDALELSVAQNLYELEQHVPELKQELALLQFTQAKEVSLCG
jgi:small subunit ribosomal protein S7e